MERNIDFDSDVEVLTLKDSVWRLTMRVYLLEDFIAERFGEVLSPKGYTKAKTQTADPNSSEEHVFDVNRRNSSSCSTGSLNTHSRKRRKRKILVTNSRLEVRDNKIQKPTADNSGIFDEDEDEVLNHRINNSNKSKYAPEDEHGDSLLIPKDEVLYSDYDGSDNDEDFMDDSYDDGNDPNDSLEKDPNFVVPNQRIEKQDMKGEVGSKDIFLSDDKLKNSSRKVERKKSADIPLEVIPVVPITSTNPPDTNSTKGKFYLKLDEDLKRKSANTKSITTEKYLRVLDRLKCINEGAKRTLNDVNILQSYRLASFNDEYHLVNRKNKRICPQENLFEMLEKAHQNTKHGGREKMKRYIDTAFGNITIDQINIFLSLCGECQIKRATHKKPIVVDAAPSALEFFSQNNTL